MTERIEAIAAKCRAENWERADLDYVQFAIMIIRECDEFIDPGMKPFLFKHFGVEL